MSKVDSKKMIGHFEKTWTGKPSPTCAAAAVVDAAERTVSPLADESAPEWTPGARPLRGE